MGLDSRQAYLLATVYHRDTERQQVPFLTGSEDRRADAGRSGCHTRFIMPLDPPPPQPAFSRFCLAAAGFEPAGRAWPRPSIRSRLHRLSSVWPGQAELGFGDPNAVPPNRLSAGFACQTPVSNRRCVPGRAGDRRSRRLSRRRRQPASSRFCLPARPGPASVPVAIRSRSPACVARVGTPAL